MGPSCLVIYSIHDTVRKFIQFFKKCFRTKPGWVVLRRSREHHVPPPLEHRVLVGTCLTLSLYWALDRASRANKGLLKSYTELCFDTFKYFCWKSWPSSCVLFHLKVVWKCFFGCYFNWNIEWQYYRWRGQRWTQRQPFGGYQLI